ncbi:pirin family protein [Ilumatobacter sp.]|uniref:pirin family protein n=1 Tax=Ilumatobacter sp. TaxID=1967498 RepID=UPI003AF4A42F
MTQIDIRRADERFATKLDWLDSKHSFSFGPHHDPDNTHHGLLWVNNDDIVRGGTGFDTHAHRDMEIVTWVLAGELEHRDSEGNHGVITPGLAQRMSAGTGIRHSERNPSSNADVHFLQMWVPPDTGGIDPGYEQLDVSAELASGDLFPIASGKRHESAITIFQRDAVLWGGRIAPGRSVDVPVDRHVHLYVARGSGVLEPGGQLGTGDAARLYDPDGSTFTAGPAGAEVSIWATA